MATLTFVGSLNFQSSDVASTSFTMTDFLDPPSVGNDLVLMFNSLTQYSGSFFTASDNASNTYGPVYYIGPWGQTGEIYSYVVIAPSITGVPTSIVLSWVPSGSAVRQAEIEAWDSGGYLGTYLDNYTANYNTTDAASVSLSFAGDVVFSWMSNSGTFSSYPSGWVEGLNADPWYSAGIIEASAGTATATWGVSGSGNTITIAGFTQPPTPVSGVGNQILRPSFAHRRRW